MTWFLCVFKGSDCYYGHVCLNSSSCLIMNVSAANQRHTACLFAYFHSHKAHHTSVMHSYNSQLYSNSVITTCLCHFCMFVLTAANVEPLHIYWSKTTRSLRCFCTDSHFKPIKVWDGAAGVLCALWLGAGAVVWAGRDFCGNRNSELYNNTCPCAALPSLYRLSSAPQTAYQPPWSSLTLAQSMDTRWGCGCCCFCIYILVMLTGVKVGGYWSFLLFFLFFYTFALKFVCIGGKEWVWMLAGELIIILISTEALMDLQEMSDLSSQQVYSLNQGCWICFWGSSKEEGVTGNQTGSEGKTVTVKNDVLY